MSSQDPPPTFSPIPQGPQPQGPPPQSRPQQAYLGPGYPAQSHPGPGHRRQGHRRQGQPAPGHPGPWPSGPAPRAPRRGKAPLVVGISLGVALVTVLVGLFAYVVLGPLLDNSALTANRPDPNVQPPEFPTTVGEFHRDDSAPSGVFKPSGADFDFVRAAHYLSDDEVMTISVYGPLNDVEGAYVGRTNIRPVGAGVCAKVSHGGDICGVAQDSLVFTVAGSNLKTRQGLPTDRLLTLASTFATELT